MPTASIKKIIPCNKKDLVTMILDIEKYPEFVPWCLSGKIHRKDDKPDMIEMEADLTVGKKFLNQTYTSHVTYYKDNGKILVNNIGGPLKHLENKWQIREINNPYLLLFGIILETLSIIIKLAIQMKIIKTTGCFHMISKTTKTLKNIGTRILNL